VVASVPTPIANFKLHLYASTPKHNTQHVAHLHHVRTPVQANLLVLDPDPQRPAPLAAHLGQARPEHDDDAPLALAVGVRRRRQALHGRRRRPPVVAGLVAAGLGVDVAASLGRADTRPSPTPAGPAERRWFLSRRMGSVDIPSRQQAPTYLPHLHHPREDDIKRRDTTQLRSPVQLHTYQPTHPPVKHAQRYQVGRVVVDVPSAPSQTSNPHRPPTPPRNLLRSAPPGQPSRWLRRNQGSLRERKKHHPIPPCRHFLPREIRHIPRG
jgi:hypothetical protein